MKEVYRVREPDRPAFQLRPGEIGISVFDPEAVDPPLVESEVLEAFRAGSIVTSRTLEKLRTLALELVPVPGHADLPERLIQAHREIRPGDTMSRAEFKKRLRELESNVD
jgi:hypothetical protein